MPGCSGTRMLGCSGTRMLGCWGTRMLGCRDTRTPVGKGAAVLSAGGSVPHGAVRGGWELKPSQIGKEKFIAGHRKRREVVTGSPEMEGGTKGQQGCTHSPADAVAGGEMAARRGLARLAAGTGGRGRTAMSPGAGPQPRQCVEVLPALGGHAAGVPSPSRAGTGDPAPPCTPHRPGVTMWHRGHAVTRPHKGETWGRTEEQVPPGRWHPSPPVSHGRRAAAAAPTPEPPRASRRWEMAPCHHGNGATGSPRRGDTPSRGDTRAEGTRVPSPEERGTEHRLPGPPASRHGPHHPAVAGTGWDVAPVRCHPSRASPPRLSVRACLRQPGPPHAPGCRHPRRPLGAQRWAGVPRDPQPAAWGLPRTVMPGAGVGAHPGQRLSGVPGVGAARVGGGVSPQLTGAEPCPSLPGVCPAGGCWGPPSTHGWSCQGGGESPGGCRAGVPPRARAAVPEPCGASSPRSSIHPVRR